MMVILLYLVIFYVFNYESNNCKLISTENILLYRADDYNDPIHLERISTLNMFETRDLGAIPTGKVAYIMNKIMYRRMMIHQIFLID